MIIFTYSGWAAWIIVCIVMLAKPLSILFRGFFVKIIPYRQWLGVLLSLLVIVHVIIFTANIGYELFFLKPNYWNFAKYSGWGGLAFIVMIPLFITSNKTSMKLLKRNWKRIQQLAYIFFVAAGLHIYLANDAWYYTLLPMGVWLLLYVAAFVKLHISKKKRVGASQK